MLKTRLICVAVAMLLSVSVAHGQSGVRLPAEYRILPPGPDVPREQAAYSGKWFGRWDGSLEHILIVEEITLNPPRVITVYAWGSNQVVSQPGWSRIPGLFVRGELHLERRPNGPQIRYRMLPNDTLDATYELGSYLGRATMRRMQE